MNRASAMPDTVFFVGIGQAPVPLFIAFCSLREQLRNAQCFFYHEWSQWANRWMNNWFLRVFDPCIGGRALWNYIVVECDNGIEYDNGIEPAAAILLCKFFHIDKQWFFLPIAFMNKSLRHTSDCCMDFCSGIGRIFALSCASRHG